MVKLLIGRAGAGKSPGILEKMASSAPERRQILIVPEQHSHEAERRLCSHRGNVLSLNCEVLTFTRLANRVFSQAGGLAAPTLDGGGRLLVMYLAVRQVADGLSVYRRPSRRPAFLAGLLDTLDECKSYQITPQALQKASSCLPGAAGEKLYDLGLIFTAYDALCQSLGADPRDRLTRLAQALRESRWGEGADFYLDGFTDFTPQQGLVLTQLMDQAHSVTFALTCDHLLEDEDGMGIFSPARKTGAYLTHLARKVGQPVETETLTAPRTGKAPALAHLEQHLFADTPAPWHGPAPVTCVQLPDPRAEVEHAAAEVLRLCREEGLRFRDIAVTARDFGPYEELVSDIFPRYNIPVFLSRTEDILQKPVLALITAALDAVSGGYRYEDLFRYLKTGLGNITDDARDKLENYVLTWDIKGSKWTSKTPWHMHPAGYGETYTDETEAALAELDALRREVIAPLETLRKAKGATGRDRAMALYAFLENIDLPGNLSRRVELLRQRGDLNRADEYSQLWNILKGALEQCAVLLRDVEMDLEEFSKLFALTLSQYRVGSIPVALDRVTAGPCPRLGYRSCKALLLLGCDDRQIPLCQSASGLLTDDDRQALTGLGLTLAPRMEDKLLREMTIVYTVCALPTHRLWVSYPAASDGETRRPSFLIPRLHTLFPDLPAPQLPDPRLAAPEPAMELARDNAEVARDLRADPVYGPRLTRMENALALGRGSLSPQGVEALYGRRVPMSASRLDLYRSCHFSYFMRYGLDAQPRKAAEFDAPAYGTFLHKVLEEVLQNWDKSMDAAATRKLARQAMDRYLAQKLGGLEDKTPRFAYLFRRLRRTVERVVENVTDELRCSDFTPIDFELGFGSGEEMPAVELTMDGFTISITGLVDRVDGWEKDGKLYLRVVDYKTGKKPFDLTDIFNGIGLQMLLYLFTLKDRGRERFGFEEIIPAGVLYIPAREAVVDGSRDMTEEERLKLVDKALTRQGLLLHDPQVLEAMEHGEPRFLPVKVKKDGSFTTDSLASLEQLGRLETHLRHILEQVGREMAAGTVEADPYWRGPDHNACMWCEFRSACQFDEGRDRRRCPRKLGAKEFWTELGEEDTDGSTSDD